MRPLGNIRQKALYFSPARERERERKREQRQFRREAALKGAIWGWAKVQAAQAEAQAKG